MATLNPRRDSIIAVVGKSATKKLVTRPSRIIWREVGFFVKDGSKNKPIYFLGVSAPVNGFGHDARKIAVFGEEKPQRKTRGYGKIPQCTAAVLLTTGKEPREEFVRKLRKTQECHFPTKQPHHRFVFKPVGEGETIYPKPLVGVIVGGEIVQKE